MGGTGAPRGSIGTTRTPIELGTRLTLCRFRNMLDHTGIVVSDLAKARRFYDAIAEALGLVTRSNSEESFLFGRSAAPSKQAVDAFHRAAIAIGGRDNGAPGPHEGAGDY